MASFIVIKVLALLFISGSNWVDLSPEREVKYAEPYASLIIKHDQKVGTLSVFKDNGAFPILVQNAKEQIRPYIHPIMAPDGKGVLTEYQPSHHKHQTGLYWGLKMVNGRDFFMNWQGQHYRRVSAKVLEEKGDKVKWQTVYNLLDENGNVVLTETQNWAMQEVGKKYILDLAWRGEAKADITFGQFYVGGLFLRMPWRKGMPGEVINAIGQRNQEAEQQRAVWNDIGLQINGREDFAHIAILDHPDNKEFPIAWRVDGELGVGPSRQILGDWQLAKGEVEEVQYRLIAYTGSLDKAMLNQFWKAFACEN